MATKLVYNDTQVVASLTNTDGAVWESSVITYNFPTSISIFADEWHGFSHATANQQSMSSLWLRAWDDVIASSIVRISDSEQANITVANSAAPDYAYAYYPSPGFSADVYLNPAYGNDSGTDNLVNPTLGEWGAASIGHEIGHALGLSHPSDYDGGDPTYEANAQYMQDSQQYTIMSYFTADETGSDWVASDNKMHYAETPMMNDIIALQSLYGADLTTRATATTYGFHSTLADSVYDFSVNSHPVLCIYDAGGIDTLNLSGYRSASRISLLPGSFSDADAMTNNISIARDVTIENAIGGGGNDALIGNAANNILNGGRGHDILSGASGNDTYIVDNSLDQVLEQPDEGVDTVLASVTYALGANLENLVLSGTGPSNGTGNELNNSLFGGNANNILDGGIGADTMAGGLGNDTYFVDNALDKVTEWLNQGADSVIASVTYTLTANVENLTLTGPGTINGSGNERNNILVGNDASNILDGAHGADTMAGGLGDDIYIIDNQLDKVIEQFSQGADTVSASVTYALAANVENLTLTGLAAVNGSGNELNNTLIGNGANNILNGGDGNDLIIGGGGQDRLTGGAGADIFRFVAFFDSVAGQNRDVISDFSMEQGDAIDISQIYPFVTLPGNHVLHWADEGFTGNAGEVFVNSGILMCDVNGDALADFEIQLLGVMQIQHEFVTL